MDKNVTFKSSVDDPYHLPNGFNAHAVRKITPENGGECWTKDKPKRKKIDKKNVHLI